MMDRQGNVIITKKPKLRHPYMVCGIDGWVDGGESATGSTEYLIRKLEAKKFAEIPLSKFHIFQVPGQLSLRPYIKIEDGRLKEHHFPQNQFFYWVNHQADNDLIFYLGTEPNLHWEEYTETILSVAEEFAVKRIYILGGVLDKAPHTKEPGVSCACIPEQLRAEMQAYGIQFSNYEGPGSFGTTLLNACRNKQVEAVSVIARSTYYPEFNIIIPRNPKSIRALIMRLNSLLHLNLDISDLDKEVEELEAKLEFTASHNPDFRDYVSELEKNFVEVKYEEPLDISGREAVRLAEEFLKREEEN
jgi:proteasome assembly chaperone (PAC2) family protein